MIESCGVTGASWLLVEFQLSTVLSLGSGDGLSLSLSLSQAPSAIQRCVQVVLIDCSLSVSRGLSEGETLYRELPL